MEIVPYFGEQIITSSDVEVRVNPNDRRRAKEVVARTSAVSEITDEVTFSGARQAAAELKAMVDEIAAAKKQAKLPFASVERAIDNQALIVLTPVQDEHKRILALLNGYVEKLEAAIKAEQRRENEARRLAQEAADRKVREAQALLAETEAFLRKAQDESQRTLLRAAAAERENKLLQEQLAASLAADVDELGKDLEPQRGLVPGGRVDHIYDFKLINVQQTCEARCYRLLRWELDIQACRDSVKSQLEGLPEIEPTLPGIQITKRLNVSVKAASRIK
jgi:hypothetical protein